MTTKRVCALALLLLAVPALAASPAEQARWRAQAARTTITRDDWGIAHVHGRSDADAVFGAIYAQAEDDFPRVEANYLAALGRTAEAEGEAALWRDLRRRLWVDPAALRAHYRAAPQWLRRLCDAWADGLNLYLSRHPEVRPRVLTRFEPWMPFAFSEGSIGGDIERADLGRLAAFYAGDPTLRLAAAAFPPHDQEPRGSNGIAIAPKLTAGGHAMLLINPHTSFFFRSELEMRSDAGLHAYGAATWGQFFLYQGFNEHLGWMHTSTGADTVDEFAETTATRGGRLMYRHGAAWRPVTRSAVTLRVRQDDGSFATRRFAVLRTHHGPVIGRAGDRLITMALMDRPVAALQQSWLRTRAATRAGYLQVAALQANSSNNTVYADDQGHIGLLMPQFVPRRDTRLDWRAPVDGSDPAADWHGLTRLADLPRLADPATGWLYNSNDWPWTAAGPASPRAEDFPAYLDQAGANPRGVHARRLLGPARGLTPEGLMRLAYDPALPAFDPMLARLFAAYDALASGDPRRAALAEPIATLRGWDRRASAMSEPASLAIFFGEALWKAGEAPARAAREPVWDWFAGGATAEQYLAALEAGTARLRAEWGSLRVPWGEINRFQRNDAAIVQRFSDSKPSIPVPFASARWGSLASFGAQSYPGTRRWYGTSGNSFVAVVEFGPRVRAWAVSAGGESGHPTSPHFSDQAMRYAAGDLRPVYFWPDELAGHVERRYRPGE